MIRKGSLGKIISKYLFYRLILNMVDRNLRSSLLESAILFLV